MARVKGKQPKQFYSKLEAAAILGVSEHTVYRWAKAGRLTAVKVGGSSNAPIRITRASIEALLGEPIAAPVPIEAEPAPIDAAPSPAPSVDVAKLQAIIEELREVLKDVPLFKATPGEAQGTEQDKPTTLADVFTALESLQNTIERAKVNPHYCHVQKKINSVMDVLQNVSQELHKADDIADDLRKAYLGR